LRVSLRPNKHFRLPTDDRPIVLIGPGTGLAPFRAFLQEREATGHGGPSWLFFGHRRFTHDFLYQLEIQEWLKTGVLSRLDVAFSRDQPEKIYVQHRLWQQRAELRAWIEDGAALYVCGDAKAMARDVHATLLRILGEGSTEAAAAALLRAMQQDGRYLRDVY
jgi:sulfite reductase (NADPH) flavoprotein alpha-component